MSDIDELEKLARAAAEATNGGNWTRERDWVEVIDSHAFIRPYAAVGRYILAANPDVVLALIERVREAEVMAAAAVRYYDNLDIDSLDREYFSAGSPGEGQRRLRDAVRAYRGAMEKLGL